MKNETIRLSLAVLGLIASGIAFGQTQVPNTFQSGQPARAAEVNGNFTTLEAASNNNATSISSNAAAIVSNVAAIGNNAAGIASNSSIASSNITEIQNNATNIATNTASIAANAGIDVYYRTAGGTPIINMSGQVHTERATCDDTNDKVIGGGYQLIEGGGAPGYPQMIYESADPDPNAPDAWEVRAIPNEDGQAVVAQVICVVVE